MCQHIAEVGRLEQANLIVASRQSERESPSSPEDAAFWRDALNITHEVAAAVKSRVALLVVDATSTLWPITVAAAKLRRSGAAMVIPLVIHRRP